MTDRIEKILAKLSERERKKIASILAQMINGQLSDLDMKKLRGSDDIYRIRKGDLRIIFWKKDAQLKILAIERRSDTTYHEF